MILVGVAAGAFILDKLVTALWWEPWKQVTEQIRKADEDLARAKSTLKREVSAREGWKTIRSLLDQQRIPDVQTHFGEHLTEMCERVDPSVELEYNPQAVQVGDFKEYLYEAKSKLTWEQFVDLLGELQSSKEFLKLKRVNINSQYEREDRLDIDLRLSTIEYAPVPQRRS